jgi:thiol-disulfide isomerase/thioredoxin
VLRIAAASALLVAIAGCSSDPLAEDYLDGGNSNYITGSGITEVPPEDRGEPIVFEGTTDAGEALSSADYLGEVLVVNFWYASCEPCRQEAPDLEALAGEYEGEGAAFVGVNIYDSADTSLAFARKFDVGYPSLLDVTEGAVRTAFAGEISPKAVPTTFVLDAEGRIAARILGQLQEKSILDTLIRDTAAESS